MNVRTPEGVDRLFGVGDHDKGRLFVRDPEQPREDAPLHRVGVLKLVDEGYLETPAQRGCRGLALLQGVSELSQKVVERQCACNPAPPVDLVHGAVDKAAQSGHRRHRARVRGVRDKIDSRVAEHCGGQGGEIFQARQRLGDIGRGKGFGCEHVGADRLEELARVVEQRGVEIARGR